VALVVFFFLHNGTCALLHFLGGLLTITGVAHIFLWVSSNLFQAFPLSDPPKSGMTPLCQRSLLHLESHRFSHSPPTTACSNFRVFLATRHLFDSSLQRTLKYRLWQMPLSPVFSVSMTSSSLTAHSPDNGTSPRRRLDAFALAYCRDVTRPADVGSVRFSLRTIPTPLTISLTPTITFNVLHTFIQGTLFFNPFPAPSTWWQLRLMWVNHQIFPPLCAFTHHIPFPPTV